MSELNKMIEPFINVYRYRSDISKNFYNSYEGFSTREDAAIEAAETYAKKCTYLGTLERTETGWTEVDLEDYGWRLVNEREAEERAEERHIREISSPFATGRL